MRARMAAYSAWNSAPSRLSHSSSDARRTLDELTIEDEESHRRMLRF
jgi:hypothetical protein